MRISRLLERRADERGFTLIELAVAVGVFGIFLIGFSFIFESAFSTSNEVRFDQRAKTLAQEKMEEVRALPFYVSQRTGTGDVDILDRYFPGTANATTPTGAQGTYDGSSNVWTYTSTESIDDQAGRFTRRVGVTFIVVAADGTVTPRPPITGYDSDNADLDRPTTNALRVTTTVSWTVRGRPHQVRLETIITRIRQEEPKVEVTGSVAGAQISGLEFYDGLAPGGVGADILAIVGQASVSYREVTESTAQASSRAVEVVERHPDTNTPIQPEQTTQGMSSASVPNATSGVVQADPPSSMAAGSLVSLNDPRLPIATWGASSPAAATEARVSPRHTLNPEARAAVTAGTFRLNARNESALTAHRALDVGATSGQVEHRSTTTEARVTAGVSLTGVVISAAPQFTAIPDFAGTVVVDAVTVESQAVASTTTSSTAVDWTVRGLRLWDPDQGLLGGYVGPWTFGFISSCGGWVGDPILCGPDRTDGLDPFQNPNPVVIPAAYVGTDPLGNESLSLTISAGATVRESAADASLGAANASAAQKNVLSITLRNDIVDAEPLEPMVIGLGDANASVSYVEHEH